MDAFNNLDAASIYTRFFVPKRHLTDEELKTVTEVNFDKTVALVVIIPAGNGEEIIVGAGRCLRQRCFRRTKRCWQNLPAAAFP